MLIMRVELQFRVSREAYRRFKKKRADLNVPTMGELLDQALADFLDEVDHGQGTYERKPPNNGPERRGKLYVDAAIADRLQRTSEAVRAAKEEMIRQAIGRLVDWY